MTSPSDASGETAWGYRPHLDGLRAVAVYLVVAFHAGLASFGGGFIGVDVFFVLSGFLVTHLLLRDLHADGSIGFRRFYARRFRRLLPAAAVVLIVTAIVFPGIGAPSEVLAARGAVRSASLYFSNWFFIGQARDYFASDIQANPVLHFWSLSVEEQFYAAWPLLLGGIYAVARRFRERTWAVVRIVVGVGMVASLGAALQVATTSLNRAYYGTDTRAYQLLAGALLALSPGVIATVRRSRVAPLLPGVAFAALGGLVVVGSSVLQVGAVTRGVAATALTISLIVALEARPAGPARALLSLPPIVYLGRISYGVYLWHWLVIIVTLRNFALGPLSVALVAALVASGLAALSYQVLERPVRESSWLDARRVRVVAVGLAASALIGVVLAPRVLERDVAASTAVVAGGTSSSWQTPVPANLDWRGAAEDHGKFPRCEGATPEKCTIVRGSGPHVLLMGDSNARMYLPMFTKLAEDHDLTLSVAVAPGCPWQRGILRRGEGLVGADVVDLGPPCRTHHADWYDLVIPALDPDVIIVANQPFDDAAGPRPIQDEDTGSVDVGTQAFLDVVTNRTNEAVDQFRADGRTVVIIEPAPIATDADNPLTCLSEAVYIEKCRFTSHRSPTPVEVAYRKIAAKDPKGVYSLDVDQLLCPYLPICDPIVNNLIVRWDSQHITARFALTLEEPLFAYLQDNGILK